MICKSNRLFDFGRFAAEYDRWYDTAAGRAHDRVQKRNVRRLLPPALLGQRLLDVGCGTGHWSAFFGEMGYQVTGVDISPEMVDEAREASSECSFQVADACELPFPAKTFDVVAAMATIEFIPKPEVAVREMGRCTRRGGCLLIGTLNRLAPLNQRRVSRRREPYASAHMLSPAELEDLLASYGRVRMCATPRPTLGRTSLQRRTATQMEIRRPQLRGAFLVAEVRT